MARGAAAEARRGAVWVLRRVSRVDAPETTRELRLRAGSHAHAGRGDDCALLLKWDEQNLASRVHADLFVDAAGDLFVADKRSTNGVVVNGEIMQKGGKRQLMPKDVVSFGGRKLTSLAPNAEQALIRLKNEQPFSYQVTVVPAREPQGAAKAPKAPKAADVGPVEGASSEHSSSSSQAPAENGLESNLVELLECSLCLDLMREPILLTCSHSFCRGCWMNWVERQDKNRQEAESGGRAKRKRTMVKAECPTCRKNVPIAATVVLALQNLIAGVKSARGGSTSRSPTPPAPTAGQLGAKRQRADAPPPLTGESRNEIVVVDEVDLASDSEGEDVAANNQGATTAAVHDLSREELPREDLEEVGSETGGVRLPAPSRVRHSVGDFAGLGFTAGQAAAEPAAKGALQAYVVEAVLRRTRHESLGLDLRKVRYRGHAALVVSGCEEGSQGWRKGIRPNDMICEMNGVLCVNLTHEGRFDAVMRAFKEDPVLKIKVRRGLLAQ